MHRMLSPLVLIRLLVPLLCLSLVGCGPKGSPKLEGMWLGVRATGVADEQQAAADDFARHTVLEFRSDAVAIRTPKGVQVGHYKVVHDDNTSLTIVTDKDGVEEPHTFTFDDPKTLAWKILPNRTIVLNKSGAGGSAQ